MPDDRTPFFCGSFPVATAAHTASADVGCSVARCRTAPASRIRPKFGSRPSAVALVIRSSDARVDRDHRDTRADRSALRHVERGVDRPRLEQRRHAASAQRQQRRDRARRR